MCQIEYDKNVAYMSNTMPDRMPEYMSGRMSEEVRYNFR